MANSTTHIKIESTIEAPIEKVWQLWTTPVDITNWNTASPDWHTPSAKLDLRPGGSFTYRMEAKDGSFGFDFEGIFETVKPSEELAYTMADGRRASTTFAKQGNQTLVTTIFDAETDNPVEMQQAGWQAILNNFKNYAEKVVLLDYSIEINASKQKTWETMLHPDTYQEWVRAGWGDSIYVGKWEEGAQIKFVSLEGGGMLAEIMEHRPFDFTLAKHIAVLLKDGAEDRDSDLAKGLVGNYESYTFLETNGSTRLNIQIGTNAQWSEMYNDGWPKALAKLKEICE